MDDKAKSEPVIEQQQLSPPQSLPGKADEATSEHGDDANKILNAYDGPETWTEQEEKKLRRRIDWKLMPVLCFTYGLQYYDKAMLGQAALFGLRTDLSLTGNRYSMSAAIFYLGFIIGAYPTMVLAQKFPIHLVASGTVTVWGICLILTPACTNYQGLYAQRFFLGALESGISPMFMLIVGSWYKKNEQAFRIGIWYSMTGYVSIVSPLINWGLGHITGALSSWKYMYFFAGGITILWGILLVIVLPTDPVRAKGFDDRERFILVARLRSNNSGVKNTHYKMSQVVELLLDIKFWLCFFIAILCMVSNGAISTFIPVVINGFGFNTLNSLLLVMPVGAYGGTAMLIASFLAYKFKNIRTYIHFVCQMGTTLSCALLWKLPLSSLGGLLFACIILPSTGAGYGVLMGLQVANTTGYTKRSIASSGLYIGYCLGNFIGPLIFLTKEAPRYPTAFIVTLITAAVAGVLGLAYRFICVWDNRRRDATGSSEGFDHAYEDPTDKENPQFRYIL